MTEGCTSVQNYGGTATVDRKRLTADVARRLRGKEHYRPLDIVFAAGAAQRCDLRDLIGPFRQPGRQLGREIARTDGVDVDVVPAPLGRERLGKRDQRAFACIVGDREAPPSGRGPPNPAIDAMLMILPDLLGIIERRATSHAT